MEQPEGHSETGDELFCWFDHGRVCGGDCVAFDPEGVGIESRSTCLLVNAVKQCATGLAVIGRTVQGAAKVPGSSIQPPGVGS